ncbi:hypothetical protein SAMN04488564_12315 [Lentzea waywayandensis]|uniref:LPXTG-motif cell wall anchor domain-containing protein n=1 Tax=Lentzea waywayandensis TaxID=84724 RepID=A0A1I6FIZ0_9PSEU|nr:hypothetical protein [Lentzea waywayandensis]SFR29900.1 hypothetical protein SAMN04488564_12315 [Lentzea waywayandensis]
MCAGAAALVALSVLGAPGTAVAHSSSISGTCAAGRTTLSVQITSYPGENQVLVSDNGATVAGTSFGPDFRLRRDFDGTADHSFTVTVTAADDPSGTHGWSFVKKLNVARCATATPPAKPVAPQSTTVPPTTTTVTTSSPAPVSSTVPSETEVISVLIGREEPLPSSDGVSPLWTLLACLMLLGTGVVTFVIVRRRKLQ